MTTLNQILTILGLIGAILLFGPFAFQVVMVILACIWRGVATVLSAVGEFLYMAGLIAITIAYEAWQFVKKHSRKHWTAFKKHRENIRKNGRSL